jgi:DNA primase
VPLVARIKDHGLRDEYARRLAGLVGVDDPMRVVTRVRGMVRTGDRRPQQPEVRPAEPEPPRVDEVVAAVEREVLKVALQLPAVAGPEFDALEPGAFLVDAHQQVRRAIADVGGTAAAVSGPAWTAAVSERIADERVRRGVHALAVEPLPSGSIGDERYANHVLARMLSNVTARQIRLLKGRLQRINPIEAPDEHARLFGELISLESYHRGLRERANGG